MSIFNTQLAHARVYRLKNHEKAKAISRSFNRMRAEHISVEEHRETVRLWREVTDCSDDAERERMMKSLRVREREQERRLIREGNASKQILRRMGISEEEKEEMLAREQKRLVDAGVRPARRGRPVKCPVEDWEIEQANLMFKNRPVKTHQALNYRIKVWRMAVAEAEAWLNSVD